MKRLILAAGALFLATANTPPSTTSNVAPGDELDSVVAAEAPPKEDRHPAAHSAAKPAKPKPARVAAAAEPAGTYPRCSSTVRDRCVQGRSGQARAATRHAGETQTRRMQLAMRAGERG